MLNNLFKLGFKKGKKSKIIFIKKNVFRNIFIIDQQNPKFVVNNAFKNATPFIFFQKKKIKKKETHYIINSAKVKTNKIIFKWLFQASKINKKKSFYHEFYINLSNTSKNTGKIIQNKKNYQKLIEKSK